MTDLNDQPDFESLGLSAPVLKAVKDVGYETPSPIQAAGIPPLLEGHDLLGQAQTGTGKTAAFALPILSNIDLKVKNPQVLVLAPTRELAIQVAEAFQTYARYMKNFHVLPIYGGQGYDTQLRQLRRGVHVVVGTPGRVMDHMRKGTLKLDSLTTLVLDEADEMLRMGFIDDVEWVLQHTPEDRQIALFSATMPSVIKKVANKHLNKPKEIKIASKTATATTVRQRYWQVSGIHKLDALTRILETETFDAMLVFVRTKASTEDLASKLSARGYASEALNGDIAQNNRERIVDRFKKGKLDILIATDVVARGLDVERISHVINYDIPYDTESYVHRIGRTGRAGRSGDAILFVAPRENRMLHAIERATRKPIEHMKMPSTSDINAQRIVRFKQQITDTLATGELDLFLPLVTEFQQENDADPIQIAAALAKLAQGDQPLFLSEKEVRHKPEKRSERPSSKKSRSEKSRSERSRSEKPGRRTSKPSGRAESLKQFPDIKMQRYRIEVGHEHEVKPGNIVGAIANEAEMDSEYIGSIKIFDNFSTIDLPGDMPGDILQTISKARVCGQKLDIELVDENTDFSAEKPAKPARPFKSKKPSLAKSKAGKKKPSRTGTKKPAKKKTRKKID